MLIVLLQLHSLQRISHIFNTNNSYSFCLLLIGLITRIIKVNTKKFALLRTISEFGKFHFGGGAKVHKLLSLQNKKMVLIILCVVLIIFLWLVHTSFNWPFAYHSKAMTKVITNEHKKWKTKQRSNSIFCYIKLPISMRMQYNKMKRNLDRYKWV